MTGVAVRGLSVRRGERDVLSGVDVEVRAGELVVVVGPNGAGKSTLLAAIAGDLAAHAGEVRLDGRPVATWETSALARTRAVVRQATRVAAGMETLEVVRLGRYPHGDVDEPSGLRAARAALGAVGLAELEGRRVDQLSGGQEQGVHLARAIAQVGSSSLEGAPASGVLLLDEPLAGLDLARQLAFLELLGRLARAGLAVLVVVHDLDLAARVADRLVVLHDGRVEAAGPPREVLTEALLAAVFGVRARIVAAPWDPDRAWIGIEGRSERPDPAPRG